MVWAHVKKFIAEHKGDIVERVHSGFDAADKHWQGSVAHGDSLVEAELQPESTMPLLLQAA